LYKQGNTPAISHNLGKLALLLSTGCYPESSPAGGKMSDNIAKRTSNKQLNSRGHSGALRRLRDCPTNEVQIHRIGVPSQEAIVPDSSNKLIAQYKEDDLMALEKPRDAMSPDEQKLISDYRALDNLTKLAINLYLVRGDLTLVRAIYDYVFLGVRRR
jgi:hypothetical protein